MIACVAVSGVVWSASDRRVRGAAPRRAAADAARVGAQHQERARPARAGASRWRPVPPATAGATPTWCSSHATPPRCGLRHGGVHARVAVVPPLPRARPVRRPPSGRPGHDRVGARMAGGPGPRCRAHVERRPDRPGVGHRGADRAAPSPSASSSTACRRGRWCRPPTPVPWSRAALAGDLVGVAGLDDVSRPVPELVRSGDRARAASARRRARSRAHRRRRHARRRTGARAPAASRHRQSIAANAGGADRGRAGRRRTRSRGLYPGTEGSGVTRGVYELEPYLTADITTFKSCYSPGHHGVGRPASAWTGRAPMPAPGRARRRSTSRWSSAWRPT